MGPRGVAMIALFDSTKYFEDRITQLDVRLSQGMVDIYNIFNDDALFCVNLRYGSAYLRPVQVRGARLFKFGA